MPISQEEFDAVKSQLSDAAASIKNLEGEVGAAVKRAEDAEAERDSAKATIAAMPEIVAMAFAQGADCGTTVAMVKAGSKADAALVLVEANKSTGATAAGADVNESKPADASVEEESEEEAKAALAYARKLSAK